jgi:ParB family transcriptional regulator, chromosome partitioning protein
MFPDLLKDIDEHPAYILCGIDELFPNRYQARKEFRDDEQKKLVASIRKNGIIQPIIVRKAGSGYEIIAGERRWRAAQQAGLRDVPVVIREASDADAAELSLIENLQRESLNPLEEAAAFQTLAGAFGLSHEDIAQRVGKDRTTIANTVRLLKLPELARQALAAGKITAGHGRALLALPSPEERASVLTAVLRRGLSVRETERLAQNLLKKPPAPQAPRNDPAVAAAEKALSSLLMAHVRINRGKKQGKIEIRFSSAEELDRLLTALLDTVRRP